MAELKKLRSQRWLANEDFRTFNHRSRVMQMGYDKRDWEGKPVIAILNNWSDYNPCHMHFKHRVEEVKRGVLQAGGFPMEVQTISLGENLIKPSALLYRNMLAMEVEEMIRAYPVDGVVLMGGCDKTTPAMLLGATSAGLPSIFLPAGPMLRGNWGGKTLGSGSDAFKYWDDRRTGIVSHDEWEQIVGGIARSHGTCMTMGTASTMTAIAEALGWTLPGASSIPAVDASHQRMATNVGRRIVEMVHEDLRPAQIQTHDAFLNAITVAMAMGCSTNAIIHVIAQARRAGHNIGLDDFDRVSREVPVLANVRPSGTSEYLMEDFYYAGGLPALMMTLRDHLRLDALTVTGRTLGENNDSRLEGLIKMADLTINLAAICTPADYNTRPLDTIYSNFIDALPVVKYCSENGKRLIHFSTCEVYGKTIGAFLPKDSPLRQDPAYYVLKEDTSPCIFGPIEKQRWSYACAKQLIERLVYAEGAENGLEFTIVRPFNWIGPRMDFIPGIDGPSEGVPRVLACFSNNLLRREPLKLVDGGESQRTFIYIKDAIEAVLLMIENPARANGHIFNVGNPNNEVTVRQLAEMMTKVYAKVSGESSIETPTIDVSSKEFYGEGYDDSDKRIPDMTIINRQLGWNPKTSLWDLLESTLTYQHRTYAEAVKQAMSKTTAN